MGARRVRWARAMPERGRWTGSRARALLEVGVGGCSASGFESGTQLHTGDRETTRAASQRASGPPPPPETTATRTRGGQAPAKGGATDPKRRPSPLDRLDPGATVERPEKGGGPKFPLTVRSAPWRCRAARGQTGPPAENHSRHPRIGASASCHRRRTPRDQSDRERARTMLRTGSGPRDGRPTGRPSSFAGPLAGRMRRNALMERRRAHSTAAVAFVRAPALARARRACRDRRRGRVRPRAAPAPDVRPASAATPPRRRGCAGRRPG